MLSSPLLEVYMQTCAWMLLALCGVKLVALPFIVGQPLVWDWFDFGFHVVLVGLVYLPMAGRLLGWW